MGGLGAGEGKGTDKGDSIGREDEGNHCPRLGSRGGGEGRMTCLVVLNCSGLGLACILPLDLVPIPRTPGLRQHSCGLRLGKVSALHSVMHSMAASQYSDSDQSQLDLIHRSVCVGVRPVKLSGVGVRPVRR